ncbi:hypothetical protein AK812_SmicGene44576 [Symbiodinium microadriaticum]|uniref:Tyr recombinase domain-containing protein n=1 Tax=Symbiodinium microadriaticum TaxID=2951 RepID=A0A1Q9BY45_SYMMI|nr:hypothetical protein AK812_SmicGene44576 [Symbiodinium microadriaticum]
MDELDDDLDDFGILTGFGDAANQGVVEERPTRAWVMQPDDGGETRAGSAESYKAPSTSAKEAARRYIELTGEGGPGSPEAWKRVCDGGEDLVRKVSESPYLDTVLHPDLLDYLRDVRRHGLPARYLGERARCHAKLHPNGRRNLAQVYRQIWKDVCKLRVLVVPSELELGSVVSSPFDAVDKMLPDRSIAPDNKRIVHDQRTINEGTHKEWHPPAIQPRHEQIARLVLCVKSQLPGIKVLMSKKDVAGAFRLLWVDPRQRGAVRGRPTMGPGGDGGGQGRGQRVDDDRLLGQLFGLAGQMDSVGQSYGGFESRILVDDNVLVEPLVGLRPWVASEVYELGVKTLLGDAAVNQEKDLIEGLFRTFQTVWGLDMDTATEEIHLPERRILKGATLLNEPAFEYGNKDLTVRAVQRFRGIATGWTEIVKGLKNELKAWRDLWELFEEARWMCARPETWPAKFGASMRELLPVRERLALPGEWEAGTVFVSSDATKTMIAAIDRTNGLVIRMPAKAAATWVQQCGEEEEVAIHVAEMLSFLAFACHVGEAWQGKVVLYGGDNKSVREWIVSRKAGTRTGRLLVRMANLVEMRFRLVLVATWWRTFHNVHADLLTRCSDDEFHKLVEEKGWVVVDVIASLRQAVLDSERFGPCLLAWGEEDRQVLMQLKERRLKRAIPQWLSPDWASFVAVELCGANRLVTDFVEAVTAAGGSCRRATLSGPVESNEVVFASIPPDVHGKVLWAIVETVLCGQCPLAVVEGPRQAPWDEAVKAFKKAEWSTDLNEYLTTEFGECAARRRKCLIVARNFSVENAFNHGHLEERARWPLRDDEGVRKCLVWDPRGRSAERWAQLTEQGHDLAHILAEGSKATGGQTASALVLMAGYIMGPGDRSEGSSLKRLTNAVLVPPPEGPLDGRRQLRPPRTPSTARVALGRWAMVSRVQQRGGGDARFMCSPQRREPPESAAGASYVQVTSQPVRPVNGDVGAQVDEWIEENICGYHAESTSKQYAGIYQKWKAWAARQGWATEFLDRTMTVEANEDKLLGFLGYLGWLGASVATMKQAVFAIKDGHKRGGQGDPTEKMFHLWMLLGALENRAPNKPRRLGVTPNMLIWVASWMGPNLATTAEEAFDATMLLAALNTAWFFMWGADLKLNEEDDPEGYVTLQFRKTKTDQEAFGTCKTMYESGVEGLCVVSALRAFRARAPQRFGTGSEALKPLFRWASGQMLRRTQVQHLLQRAAVGVGLPPERFMSHSLRIGGASALFQATGEIELVKRTGRWSSAAVQRYIHDGERALKEAAMKMATAEQKVHYT